MSGEINRVPQGLLSLLDMKARGQNPRLLSSELQLGLDALNLYGLDQRRRIRATTGVIAVVGYSYPVALRVPQNEVWVLLAQTVNVSALAAGTTYDIGPAVGIANQDGTRGDHPTAPPQTFTAGQYVGVGGVLDQPYYLPPGTEVGLFCQGVTLGTATGFIVNVDAIALPI